MEGWQSFIRDILNKGADAYVQIETVRSQNNLLRGENGQLYEPGKSGAGGAGIVNPTSVGSLSIGPILLVGGLALVAVLLLRR